MPFEYQANANPVEFPSGKALILTGTGQPTAVVLIRSEPPAPESGDWLTELLDEIV